MVRDLSFAFCASRALGLVTGLPLALAVPQDAMAKDKFVALGTGSPSGI